MYKNNRVREFDVPVISVCLRSVFLTSHDIKADATSYLMDPNNIRGSNLKKEWIDLINGYQGVSQLVFTIW
jgi:hypothetical protein